MKLFKKSLIATSLGIAMSSSALAMIATSGDVNTQINSDNFDLDNKIIVGETGTGFVGIDNNSALTSLGGTLGLNSGSSGVMTVDGAGTQWSSSGPVLVGDAGTGELVIKNGATVSASALGNVGLGIGFQAGSDGHVTVTGADSLYNVTAGNIVVGNKGKGTLDILDGGVVKSGKDLIIANDGDSSGTVNVSGSGSALDVTNGVIYLSSYGNAGDKKGTLNITDGGTASTVYAYTGNGSTGSGYINVDGKDSALNVTASLYAGREGEGHVAVTNGGTVNSKNVIVASGNAGTSKGSVTVTGAGSSLNVAQDIRVGFNGTGELNVSDNASVTTVGNTHVGNDGVGSVTVSDNSTFNTQSLYVGDVGSGSLDITGGSLVNTADVSIGSSAYPAVGTAVINVSGSGSALTTDLNVLRSGAIFVGTENKSGVLNISDDAVVSSTQIYVGLYQKDGVISSVNIGAEKGKAAVKAGSIQNAYIDLESSTAELNFNHTNNDYVFNSGIQGSGVINNISGLTKLVANNQYFNGVTNVLGGVLATSTTLGGDVNVEAPGTLVASGTILGNVDNSGTIKVGQISEAGAEQVETTSLILRGNYSGTNGTLVFDTALNSDDSDTDRLSIWGDTSGSTNVVVNNMGGKGAQTVEGIELISVLGKSDGDFVQQGRIAAGAFDYTLVRGSSEDTAQNWYLTSLLAADPDPELKPEVKPELKPEVKPELKPEVEPEQKLDAKPQSKADIKKMAVRPEAGSYIANMAAANTMFNTRLHDRLGETHYVDALTGQTEVSSMWMRHEGGRNSSKDSSGQLKSNANRYVMQLGGDIAQWTSSDGDRYHLGVMAGYANQKSNTRNTYTGHSAKGDISGYSSGIYGTWMQDNADKTGAYVDSWLQYSWFNNTVKGDGISSESYKSKGLTASVESGYTFKIKELNNKDGFYIQPKGQATWMGVKADEHREANGTKVKSEGNGNVQTRLGVKAFIKHEDKDQTFEPFVEANWLHNTKSFAVKMDNVNISQAGARDIGELKAGIEGKVNSNVNLWGNVAQQMGASGYADTAAMVGLKVNF